MGGGPDSAREEYFGPGSEGSGRSEWADADRRGLGASSEADCLLLMAGAEVGRVGVSVGALPAIFPVNYRVKNGEIYFRTGEGVKLRAALDHTVVAFEVDEANVDLREGWSVLVVGVAAEVVDEISADLDGLDPTPWAGGQRRHLIRIRPEFGLRTAIRPAAGGSGRGEPSLASLADDRTL